MRRVVWVDAFYHSIVMISYYGGLRSDHVDPHGGIATFTVHTGGALEFATCVINSTHLDGVENNIKKKHGVCDFHATLRLEAFYFVLSFSYRAVDNSVIVWRQHCCLIQFR